MSYTKQWIIVDKSLNMPQGKLAGQVAHAAVGAMVTAMGKNSTAIQPWFTAGQPKIVLGAKSKDALLKIQEEADKRNLVTCLITDSAKTVFSEPTVTCLGIGPNTTDEVGDLLKRLQLL